MANFNVQIGNIVGQAGSVVINEILTLTKENNATTSVVAQKDGSFFADVQEQSESTLTITGNLGTDTEVVLP